jgi:hypothetical protein
LKFETLWGIRGNDRLADYNLRQKEVSGFVCFNFSSSDNTTKYQWKGQTVKCEPKVCFAQ